MFLTLLACTGESPPATQGTLEVLSYNVHGLPEEITEDDTAARIEQIAPLLAGYELIGLQEDWRAGDHAVLEAGTDHADKRWFDDEVESGRAYGSGLAVFLDLPVLDYEQVHYDTCSGVLEGASDCLASKGYQRVRVQLGAGELDVYNTHFEAGGGEEDDLARAAQVELVLAALDRDSPDHAVLFMGDTNLNDDDPEDLVEVLKLKDYGLQDSCEVLGCPEPGRIDRIMVLSRGGLTLTPEDWEVPPEFVDDAGVELSDHDPIHVGMSWSVD